MTEWSEASQEIIHMAEKTVKEIYPNLQLARIGFVFRDEAPKVAGLYKFGGVSKVSDQSKVYVDLDFLIWVSEKDWEAADTKTREALLDHLLCHCGGFPGQWKIRKPEISEFAEVIGRRGLWNENLLKIDSALNHLVEHQGSLLSDAFDRITKRTGGVVSVSVDQVGKLEKDL